MEKRASGKALWIRRAAAYRSAVVYHPNGLGEAFPRFGHIPAAGDDARAKTAKSPAGETPKQGAPHITMRMEQHGGGLAGQPRQLPQEPAEIRGGLVA